MIFCNLVYLIEGLFVLNLTKSMSQTDFSLTTPIDHVAVDERVARLNKCSTKNEGKLKL